MSVETDTESENRLGLSQPLDRLTLVISIGMWFIVLYYAIEQNIPRSQYTIFVVAGAILIYISNEIAENPGGRPKQILFIGMTIVTIAFHAYLYNNFYVLNNVRIGYALPHEYVIGFLMMLTILYIIYHSYGLGIVGVILGVLGYAYVGPYLPGILAHAGITWRQAIGQMTLEFQGFYGSITQIAAAWVVLFILFAGLLNAYGAFDLVLLGCFKIASYIRSGVTQSAVISSLAMGSINGAQAANAAMTGSITIPLMKKTGMRSDSAAAIESVASSGGQIMPPVMGAAAFVMASILGVSYFSIVLAGIIPALVYYISVAIGVHFMTIRELESFEFDASEYIESAMPRWEIILESIKFTLPLILLLYLLGWLQYSVLSSALYTCILMIGLGVSMPPFKSLFEDERTIKDGLTSSLIQTIRGFYEAGVMAAPIVIVVAGINGIIDIISGTGIASKFALSLLSIAGGNLLIAAVLAMVVSIILGMGMPTVAAYIFVALLIAPSMIEVFNLPEIAAHFFVFYSALLSGLTPPIAIAVVITTGIADSNFWRTAYKSIKLAFPLFVLPFTFIYRPEIVASGLTTASLVSGILVLVGAVAISYGMNTRLNSSKIPSIVGPFVRFGLVGVGIVIMVFPL